MEGSGLVSTKEVDYLDEDKQIRGQNYVLMSFISPENVLKDKEAFYFSKFLDQFGKDMNTLFSGILAKYPDSKELIDSVKANHSYIEDAKEMDEQYKFFKSLKSSDIEAEFLKNNEFKTSMRGIKIRGVFDTIEEAKSRSEFIKKYDNKFDIFIGQVGCWCPWSPNPNDLESQEFSETQLNTLMKEYNNQKEDKDIIFEKRKTEQVNISNNVNNVSVDSLSEQLSEVDPWTAKNVSSPES